MNETVIECDRCGSREIGHRDKIPSPVQVVKLSDYGLWRRERDRAVHISQPQVDICIAFCKRCGLTCEYRQSSVY